MSPQLCLELIHQAARTLQSLIRAIENSATIPRVKKTILRRTCFALLKDVEKSSGILFRKKGSNFRKVLKRIIEVNATIKRLREFQLKEVCHDDTDDNSTSLMKRDLALLATLASNKAQYDIFSSILISVREIEKSFEFQHKLWLEKKKASKSLDCSIDQFTYGSSYFETWKAVCESRSWELITSRIKNPRMAIFGSSQGLLAFYTHFLNRNIWIQGFEILPTLHGIANAFIDKYLIENIEFKLGDMLSADVSHSDIVVLTSLCWDKQTKTKVAHKLSKELKNGCIVVDYQCDTFTSNDLEIKTKRSWRNRAHPTISNVKSHKFNDTSAKVAKVAMTSIDELMNILDNALAHFEWDGKNDSMLSSSISATLTSNSCLDPGLDPGKFFLEDIVQGSVSWSMSQKLYVFSCQRA